jgi:hypothetical protein
VVKTESEWIQGQEEEDGAKEDMVAPRRVTR